MTNDVSSTARDVESAESREGFHVEVLPQKRATRKVGAESANVFAVRIQGIRFGITHYLPPVVDLAPVYERSVHPRLRLPGGRIDRSHSTMFLIPSSITFASWAFLASEP